MNGMQNSNALKFPGPKLALDGPRYAATAGRLRLAIQVGTYPIGSRLPSVRALSRHWDLAINTVVSAYRLLELEGRIASIPRSGFCVLAQREDEVPRTPIRVEAPSPVDAGDMILSRWKTRDLPGMISLGSALPRPELLPLTALRRHLLAVSREAPEACLGYDTVPGRIELRRAIARRLSLARANVDPDQIVVTNGAQEALHLALRAICPSGSCVAIESPGYHGLIQAIGSLGLTCLEIPSSSISGISIDALRVALDEHVVSAVLCTSTYSNPSGGSLSLDGKRELVELCIRRGIPLIDDDTYGELSHDGTRPSACLAHDLDGVVVHIGSFSKSVAPGLRLGFLAPGRWSKAVQVHKITTNIATPVQPQLAVARLLDTGDFDRHRQRTFRKLGQAMQHCAGAIRVAFPSGTRVSNPGGGLVLWIEMPPGVDANRLYEDGVRNSICVAPGTLFSARRHFRHHLRLTGGWWDPAVDVAIERLGRLAAHQLRNR